MKKKMVGLLMAGVTWALLMTGCGKSETQSESNSLANNEEAISEETGEAIQEDSISEMEEVDGIGKQEDIEEKYILTKTVKSSLDGTINYIEEYKYENGVLVSSIYRSGEDSGYNYSGESWYDENGNMIHNAYNSSDEYGDSSSEEECKYNEYNDRIEEIRKDSTKYTDGYVSEVEATTVYEYEYDASGNKISMRSITTVDDREEVITTKYEYDDENRLIKECDDDEFLGGTILYEYNTEGLLVKKITDADIFSNTITFTYDHGKLIEEISDYDEYTTRKTYEYDDYGNLIKETDYQNDDAYSLVTEYVYELCK